jgi:hypothetical protein
MRFSVHTMKKQLAVSTAYGDVMIEEDKLPTLTDKDFAKLRISREELLRCFAEGVKRMEGFTDSDRVRAVAHQTYDGKWEVYIVEYSPLSDPLMLDDDGTKH